MIDRTTNTLPASAAEAMGSPAEAAEAKGRRKKGPGQSANDAPASPPAIGDALLVPATVAAALIGVSPATWWRMVSAASVPAPVKLGGGTMTRWRVEELRLWVRLGCPSRAQFEMQQANESRRPGR